MGLPESIEKEIVPWPDARVPDAPISIATIWRDLVFCSGDAGIDPETGSVTSDDAGEQTRQTLHNLETTLVAAGTSLAHVLKVNAYLADASDYDAFNDAFAERFPELPPARTTVATSLVGGVKVEIDLVAYVPNTA
jgi:2-iminobutanoate/2-iminopropanoate deaminase